MSISLQFPLEQGPKGFLQFADDQTSDAIDQNLKFMMLTVPGTFLNTQILGSIYNNTYLNLEPKALKMQRRPIF